MNTTKYLNNINTRHLTFACASAGKILAMTTLFLAAANTGAWQLTDLFDFARTNGSYPNDLMVYGNVLFGTTLLGNTNINGDPANTFDGTGTIFKINTDGTGFTTVYNFSSDPTGFNYDGTEANAGLVLYNNVLYGTTAEGGRYAYGSVFKLNTNGTGFTTIHDFNDNDGYNWGAKGGVLLFSNTLYGRANSGGFYTWGTLFKVNTDGSGFTVLHNFTDSAGPTDADGGDPRSGLVLSSNTLYGTTYYGGTGTGAGGGVVFKVNTNGSDYKILYNFSSVDATGGTNSDGSNPMGDLTVINNTLYGMTSQGGPNGNGTIFKINTDGTGFTVLANIGGDGCLTVSGSSFYGVNLNGVFTINTDGTGFVTLYQGYYPGDPVFVEGRLVMSGNGLYGPGIYPGYSFGSVFALSPSQPVIKSIVLNTNDAVTISCSGDAGFWYWMQATTNLAPPISWQTISTNVPDANGNWQFTDFTPTNMIYGCFTNLVYTNSGSPIDPGNTNLPTLIGTNIWCGDLPATPMRFYRAAVAR